MNCYLRKQGTAVLYPTREGEEQWDDRDVKWIIKLNSLNAFLLSPSPLVDLNHCSHLCSDCILRTSAGQRLWEKAVVFRDGCSGLPWGEKTGFPQNCCWPSFVLSCHSLSLGFWTCASWVWVTMKSRDFPLRLPTSCNWWNWTSPVTVRSKLNGEWVPHSPASLSVVVLLPCALMFWKRRYPFTALQSDLLWVLSYENMVVLLCLGLSPVPGVPFSMIGSSQASFFLSRIFSRHSRNSWKHQILQILGNRRLQWESSLQVGRHMQPFCPAENESWSSSFSLAFSGLHLVIVFPWSQGIGSPCLCQDLQMSALLAGGTLSIGRSWCVLPLLRGLWLGLMSL